jgi:LysM repeat protein
MIKYILTTYVLLFILNSNHAQQLTQQQYVEKFRNIAIAEQQRSGVPAAITLAQGVLESESGNSYLAMEGKNHFGIKCKTEWTGEKLYKDDDERQECFRKYNTDAESYTDHSNFLKYRPYYKACFAIDVKDYKAWAICLKKSGYATERNYPEMLVALIEKLALQQYTLQALQEQGAVNTQKNANAIPVQQPEIDNNTSKPIPVDTTMQPKAIMQKTEIPMHEQIDNNNYNTVTTQQVGVYGNTITINGVKAIMAYKNTPLLFIAQKFNIPLAKLKAFNDLQNKNTTPNEQPIFLSAKKNWGIVDTYVYQSGETLYQIAQQQGMYLEVLMQLNNIKFGNTVKAGTVLKLNNQAAKNSFKEKVNRLIGK